MPDRPNHKVPLFEAAINVRGAVSSRPVHRWTAA
ncbi:hypothetical protein MT49_4156 [Mycobacterium tuberculosis 49-02]|nr:hypothetical protein MT49_4156 [Mycobacterium tuberculosis 49-02]COY55346.1 Uncharacterised protein [Mycobacterium tuberculosis]